MSLASRTPPEVPQPKANTPMTMMIRVLGVRKVCAVAVAPTDTPSMMVTMFISSFCAVLLRRLATPDSVSRLPSIRQPTRGAAEGTSMATKMVTTIGKMIFSVLETGRSAVMRMQRSSLVVSARMIGG